MQAFSSIVTALFRPAKGVDGAGAAIKWLWVPLAILLVASVVGKALVASPMQATAQQEAAQAAIQEQMKDLPKEEQAKFEQDMEAGGGLDTAMSIASTAAIVFGVVGSLIAILYVGTFFFVAAKTWANPVKFTSMLSVASLMFVPHAIRNIIQAVYMSSTGIWLQHAGLGALVAPKDLLTPPSAAYAVLSQIDLWVLWGLFILFGALLSTTIGFQKKRALTAMAAFVIITGLAQAVPTIVSGVFMGAGGGM